MSLMRRLTDSTMKDAADLVGWLNDRRTSEESLGRVRDLVIGLKVIAASKPVQMAIPSAKAQDALKKLGIDPAIWKKVRGPRDVSAELIAKAQAALAQYSFKPAINIYSRPVPGKETLRIVLAPAELVDRHPGEAVQLQAIDRRMSEKGSSDNEAWAVLRLVNLAHLGQLSRVTECACGRWFARSKTTQRHCSDKCRKTAYEARPERIEKKRKYMREFMREFRKELAKERKRAAHPTR